MSEIYVIQKEFLSVCHFLAHCVLEEPAAHNAFDRLIAEVVFEYAGQLLGLEGCNETAEAMRAVLDIVKNNQAPHIIEIVKRGCDN